MEKVNQYYVHEYREPKMKPITDNADLKPAFIAIINETDFVHTHSMGIVN